MLLLTLFQLIKSHEFSLSLSDDNLHGVALASRKKLKRLITIPSEHIFIRTVFTTAFSSKEYCVNLELFFSCWANTICSWVPECQVQSKPIQTITFKQAVWTLIWHFCCVACCLHEKQERSTLIQYSFM